MSKDKRKRQIRINEWLEEIGKFDKPGLADGYAVNIQYRPHIHMNKDLEFMIKNRIIKRIRGHRWHRLNKRLTFLKLRRNIPYPPKRLWTKNQE